MPDDAGLNEVSTGPTPLPVSQINPQVYVSATATNNKQWTDLNRIGPIPKDCSLNFRITNPEVIPPNATVHWMARNEGHEAEDVNDLGHKAGQGLTTTDRSAYKGTHYMDCIIRLYGRIVGMRRIPVDISGNFIPRNRPAKRPYYKRIRGRR